MSSRKESLHEIEEKKRRDEEYLAAKRAAAESIEMSRATLETAVSQGEQLERCEYLMDRQKYHVERSARLVRGMTWRGWASNIFSKEVEPPAVRSHRYSNAREPPGQLRSVIESGDFGDVPDQLQESASAVKNYECNVLLLGECETKDQYYSCLKVCNELQNSARGSLDLHHLDGRSLQLLRKLKYKLKEVEALQENIIKDNAGNFEEDNQSQKTNSGSVNSSGRDNDDPLWSAKVTNNRELQSRIKQQDEHLDAIGSSIQELLHNGSAIETVLDDQNQILEKLDDGTEDIIEQTKMVARRADRIASRPLLPWSSPKSDFKCFVAVEHVETRKFLTIEPHKGNKVVLHEDLHPDLSVFEVHERPDSRLIGFMNICTRKWLGQSTLGYVVCNAKYFGRNEEWELDDGNMERTKVLCASANWGNGGWLKVDDSNGYFSVGGYDSSEKQKASMWSVAVFDA